MALVGGGLASQTPELPVVAVLYTACNASEPSRLDLQDSGIDDVQSCRSSQLYLQAEPPLGLSRVNLYLSLSWPIVLEFALSLYQLQLL